MKKEPNVIFTVVVLEDNDDLAWDLRGGAATKTSNLPDSASLATQVLILAKYVW